MNSNGINIGEVLARSINRSTFEVFSTMMGTDLPAGEVTMETNAPDTVEGVISFIGVAGSWAGTGSLLCSPSLACRLCSQFLMTEVETVNEEVLDAVAELTNMIIGNVKTELEPHLGPLGLSVPTVVFGRNFKTKSAGHSAWTVLQFPFGGETLTVKMCLAPCDKTSHIHHPAPGHTPTVAVEMDPFRPEPK